MTTSHDIENKELKTHELKALITYVEVLKEKGLLVRSDLKNLDRADVLDITYDSRNVKEGTLFFCKGRHFKKEFLEDAISRGALAYIAEDDYGIEDKPFIQVTDVRLAMSLIGDYHFDHPGSKLTMVGITGTKGKTTTAFFMKAILDAYLKSQGLGQAGISSSVEYFDGVDGVDATNTTPEAIELQRVLARAVAHGTQYMVLEISSQALKYNRVDYLDFDYGVFLNIVPDHISPIEHPTFEDYFEAKLKLFSQSKVAVINKDMDHYDRVLAEAKKCGRYLEFSIEKAGAEYQAKNTEYGLHTTRFTLDVDGKEESFSLSIPGAFQIYDALAAISIALDMGIPVEIIREAIRPVRVPGRWETFTSQDGLLTIIVDFAHSGFSINTVLSMAREFAPDDYLISVFGAYGKVESRRPDMGRAAGKYSDKIILTSSNPDREPVAKINAELGSYIDETGTPYESIADRRKAFYRALELRKKDQRTIICLLGQGSETTQLIMGQYTPYPIDAVLAKEAMEAYDKGELEELFAKYKDLPSPLEI
jgi:UDP-N-acetylmuramyl-tripeptide synthetase